LAGLYNVKHNDKNQVTDIDNIQEQASHELWCRCSAGFKMLIHVHFFPWASGNHDPQSGSDWPIFDVYQGSLVSLCM